MFNIYNSDLTKYFLFYERKKGRKKFQQLIRRINLDAFVCYHKSKITRCSLVAIWAQK